MYSPSPIRDNPADLGFFFSQTFEKLPSKPEKTLKNVFTSTVTFLVTSEMALTYKVVGVYSAHNLKFKNAKIDKSKCFFSFFFFKLEVSCLVFFTFIAGPILSKHKHDVET